MDAHYLLLLLFLLHLFICSPIIISSSQPPNSTLTILCPPSQSHALLHFKRFFSINEYASEFFCDEFAGVASFPKTESWKEGTDCCSSWDGVTCDASTGNVIALDLSCSWLYGNFPSNTTLFVHLPYLHTLDLAFNDFQGSPISPNLIGQLASLTHLNLIGSKFSGFVPSEISFLSKLVSLGLSDNYGLSINRFSFEAMTKNLTKLQSLFLNNIDMSLVVPTSFLNLSSTLMSLGLVGCKLQGNFPINVFHLPDLKKLSLSYNPSLMINLPNSNWSSSLELLALDGCEMQGSIPTSIFHLANINYLTLYSNKMSGTIPPSLFSLPLLEYLDLGNNQFIGEIPQFQSKSFQIIYLDQNKLHGQIPESIFELPNLTSLYLSSNNLVGILELDMFSKLRNLEFLALSNNNLSIRLHNTINNTWPKLSLVSLSSCNISEFPNFLGTQDELQNLDLSNNNIRGNVPRWILNVSIERLNVLNLSHNFLTRVEQLPWKNLQVLDLQSNMLRGSIPTLPHTLIFFSISDNSLSGELSSMICNLSSLGILDLSHNDLSGMIPPCLGNLSDTLLALNLQRNKFHGTIPSSYTKECTLKNLNLEGNQLEGLLPRSLGNCRELEVLDIGDNMLEDTFPIWLRTSLELQVLVLRSNKFYGSIPEMKSNDSFPKLSVFDLSNNDFKGHIPTNCMQTLKVVSNLEGHNNASNYFGTSNHSLQFSYDYSITTTYKGFEMQMVKIFHLFASIDFSSNMFEGEIPKELGNLLSLRALNLSHNKLSGHIPSSLANLTNLETLDLSSNKLIGKIPNQLVDLTFLAILNVSENQLVGPIPQGKQFDTFQSDSYKGNSELCGNPLPRKCEGEEPQTPLPSISQQEDHSVSSFFERGFSWQAVVAGFGCGMIFGASMGYVMFQIRRPEWLLMMIEGKQRRKKRRIINPARRHGRRN